MSQAGTEGADPNDAQGAKRFLSDAIRIVARVNQALGGNAPSSAALKSATVGLHALQQLALRYAEQALTKAEWIDLHRYVAQLAASEGVRSVRLRPDVDLMSLALSDYLEDDDEAGDTLLRELIELTRQGAADRLRGVYLRARIDFYDQWCAALEEDAALDNLCETVVERRADNARHSRSGAVLDAKRGTPK